MGYRERYLQWLDFDELTRAELTELTDEREIEDRFYRDLEFGTGGLRGIMGAGTNRMNRYTVRRATQGLADFLILSHQAKPASSENLAGENLATKYSSAESTIKVAIAYDSRLNSRLFAEETARVLCANGIRAYLFNEIMPTPVLSFAVKYLACDAGIVITASHNPKVYNGYKVYDKNGCQLIPVLADQVIACVQKVQDLEAIAAADLGQAADNGLLIPVGDDVLFAFIAEVNRQSVFHGGEDLKIVYTPLHGSGRVPVQNVLQRFDLDVVREQELPDGNFPTVRSPNPEEKDALALAISQADRIGAALVLGTDPDCDRVGVAVRHEGDYVLLTGNQIGALLVDFILQFKSVNSRSTLVKTIVTNDLGAQIGRRKGLTIVETLTGFKYIGDQISQFEQSGEHEFVVGYEESFGYLIGTHARDKDAVVASLLIAEMTAYWQNSGKTLIDRLDELYTDYGFYLDDLDSFTLTGLEGVRQIAAIMARFRSLGPALMPGIRQILDYSTGINGLEPTDVLKYSFDDGSWIAIRPSGTEPKIKIYYSIQAANRESASQRLRQIQETVHPLIHS